MICLKYAKQFCKEYYLIENYDQAIADKTQTWHCHHRRETDENLSRKELIAIGCYYDVHYSELIFLTQTEHKRLHNIGENNPRYGKEGTFKGKTHTEETKQKIRESIKKRGGYDGENNPNYKYHITAEELYDLYVVQGLSTYKIAEIYGCSFSCIWNLLKKFNISKSKS